MAKGISEKTRPRNKAYLIVIQTLGTIDSDVFRRIRVQLGRESVSLAASSGIVVLGVATSETAADILAKVRKESGSRFSVFVSELGQDHQVFGFSHQGEALSRLLWAARDLNDWLNS